jgi:RecD/TraA family predicted helicase
LEESIKFKGKYVAFKPIFNGDDFKIYPIDVKSCDNGDMKFLYDNYGSVTIVGDFTELDSNVEYTIETEFPKQHPKFGWQYKVIHITRDKPKTIKQIRDFLYEILTKKQTDTLLEVYPDIVDRVLNNEEVDLELTKGIKEITFNKIKEKIIINFSLMDIITEFKEYDLTLSMVKSLYYEYTSVDKIREEMIKDPYKCLCSISRVGFITADVKILSARPELTNSMQRMTSCICYLLDENESSGSTKTTIKNLLKQCIEIVPQAMEFFEKAIEDKESFYKKDDYLANKETYEHEEYIGNKLMELLDANSVLDMDTNKYISFDGKTLNENQAELLKNLTKYRVAILAGFAGSGKSQTTKAVINMLDDYQKTYRLFAPTGRASQVMKKYTNKPASTIHRGLEYNPAFGWGINKNNPLLVDYLIVDETSMADVLVFRKVLEAIALSKGTRLLLILDPAQLPSVGAGNVAYDMIQSGKIPTITLTQIFRYGEGGLYQIATDVREGKSYIDNDFVGIKQFGINSDYNLLSVPDNQSIGSILQVINGLLKKGTVLDDIIVLTALNKGAYGTVAINKAIQSVINPESNKLAQTTYGDTIFREGDRVIQIKNNYHATDEEYNDVAIFNGNIGTIREIYGKRVLVDFEEISIWYEHDELETLRLGYCISIHKSQGSGFKYVILATPSAHTFFLNRNLLYVGITRAEERVYHIGSPVVINSALRKQENLTRHTFLCEILKNWAKKITLTGLNMLFS